MSDATHVARDLVVAYPRGIRALDRVSLDVQCGMVFGLLGPNVLLVCASATGATLVHVLQSRSYR